MRKEVETSGTETEYYCDVCGEEIMGYSSYGSPTYPDELSKKCEICGKDTCPTCRKDFSLGVRFLDNLREATICRECYKTRLDITRDIRLNHDNALKRERYLYGKLVKK